MRKHTIGPWELKGNAIVAPNGRVENGDSACIARMNFGSIRGYDEERANAKLITEAPNTAAHRDRLITAMEEAIEQHGYRGFGDPADRSIYANDILQKAIEEP